jgi:hypothetical protein
MDKTMSPAVAAAFNRLRQTTLALARHNVGMARADARIARTWTAGRKAEAKAAALLAREAGEGDFLRLVEERREASEALVWAILAEAGVADEAARLIERDIARERLRLVPGGRP